MVPFLTSRLWRASLLTGICLLGRLPASGAAAGKADPPALAAAKEVPGARQASDRKSVDLTVFQKL